MSSIKKSSLTSKLSPKKLENLWSLAGFDEPGRSTAFTFDDVLVTPRSSTFDPTTIDLSGQFSRNIRLKAPFVTSPMDTVTESSMAIAAAVNGGIGVIHGNMSAEQQRREARSVKLWINGVVEKPVTFNQEQTLAEILAECQERGFDFRTFPIVNDSDKVVGFMTSGIIKFADTMNVPVKKLMYPRKDMVTAPTGTGLKKAQQIMKKHQIPALVLLKKDDTCGGMYLYSDTKRITDATTMHTLDSSGHLRVAAAVSTSSGDWQERIKALTSPKRYVDAIVIDSSHGDNKWSQQTAVDMIEYIKNNDEQIDIIIGNITNPESARMYAQMGVDGIRIGQGPGSICTTRRVTGTGMPQITAVARCALAVRSISKNKPHIPIIADGGIGSTGDVVKALAAGADSVMMGSYFAGTKESSGVRVEDNGRLFMVYRGMGSEGALSDRSAVGSRSRYSTGVTSTRVAEGVTTRVPYKGEVSNVFAKLIGGAKNGFENAGVHNLEELHKQALLQRISAASIPRSNAQILN